MQKKPPGSNIFGKSKTPRIQKTRRIKDPRVVSGLLEILGNHHCLENHRLLHSFGNQRSFGSGLLKIWEIKEPPVPVFWKIWKEPPVWVFCKKNSRRNKRRNKLGLQSGFFLFPSLKI